MVLRTDEQPGEWGSSFRNLVIRVQTMALYTQETLRREDNSISTTTTTCSSNLLTNFSTCYTKHADSSSSPSGIFLRVFLPNLDLDTNYRGADKFLARPGRKQATATELQLLQATQKNSESCPSNQVSAAAMTSPSDKKWRPFNCFFLIPVGLRTYQYPCILTKLNSGFFQSLLDTWQNNNVNLATKCSFYIISNSLFPACFTEASLNKLNINKCFQISYRCIVWECRFLVILRTVDW